MARNRKRRERPGPSGFLVVDKPKGLTSHDVVDAARRWFGTRRVGHLGTLDPLATGVLPLAIRDATKLIPFLPEATKHYRGTIRLGEATDTFDAEGTVVARHEGAFPGPDTVRQVLQEFEGDILQQPPMYSSVKHAGEPLYRLARRGETVEREPRKVRIHSIALLDYAAPDVAIDVRCTPGTYVRALAEDLGQRLGCGAHLAGLRRLASAPFSIDAARTPESLDAAGEEELAAVLVPPAEALGIAAVRIDRDALARIRNGSAVPCPPMGGPPPRPGARVVVVDDARNTVALGEIRPDRRIHPLRVFPAPEAPE
jgi:tRNA pseudouridine55 synthase